MREPTPEDIVNAVRQASASSAAYSTERNLAAAVTQHCRAAERLKETLQAAFSEDELYRLLLAVVEIHQDPLHNFDGPDTLEGFLEDAAPGGF